jgi:hypothetical protein
LSLVELPVPLVSVYTVPTCVGFFGLPFATAAAGTLANPNSATRHGAQTASNRNLTVLRDNFSMSNAPSVELQWMRPDTPGVRGTQDFCPVHYVKAAYHFKYPQDRCR